MNAGPLPLLLLGMAIGLALSYAARRTAWLAIFAAAASALIAFLIPISEDFGKVIIAGLLLSTIATAASVYLPQGVQQGATMALAINGGVWLGLLASMSHLNGELALALLLGLLFLPGEWFTTRGYDIAIKVVSSWLIAIAALAMFVSLVPTPGYEADHMQ